MLTKFVVFDSEDKAIYRGITDLSLAQRRDGLHVVSTMKFEARTRVKVSRVEVELGNKTWVEGIPVIALDPKDGINWALDVHLTDTA